MCDTNAVPKTLTEAVRYFADLDKATAFLASLRWPDGVTCPYCGSKEVGDISTRRLWASTPSDSSPSRSVRSWRTASCRSTSG
jgi:hypothetical protein